MKRARAYLEKEATADGVSLLGKSHYWYEAVDSADSARFNFGKLGFASSRIAACYSFAPDDE